MAAKYSLGKALVAIEIGRFIVIAALILLVAGEAIRDIDLSMHANIRRDAFRRLEAVRGRIVEAASSQPSASLEQVMESRPDLESLLAKEASVGDPYEHITVVSPTGVILARKAAMSTRSRPAQQFAVTSRPGDEYPRLYRDLVAFAGGDRVLDYSVPIEFGGRQLGAVYLGVSEDLLNRRIAGAHYPIRRALAPLGLACAAVLCAGGAVSWWLIRRARQMDRAAARQEHLAEVGKLASGLVHEIRNPLNAMRMQVAVIGKRISKLDDPEIRVATTQLGQLEHEVLRVQDLTRDLLAFGRPGSERPELIDTGELVADVLDFIRPEFEQLGMRAVMEKEAIGSEPLFVRMDRDKLRQALLNLTENARQAMTNGGRLTVRLSEPSRREVGIHICDTGCGIPVDELPRIFEAFFSTKDEGSGLGLAIVKQIVEAAGGRITVESRPGQGTCFEIGLPRAARHPSGKVDEVGR